MTQEEKVSKKYKQAVQRKRVIKIKKKKKTKQNHEKMFNITRSQGKKILFLILK